MRDLYGLSAMRDRPGLVDVVVVVLSPAIWAVFMVCFLLGWWASALWVWVRGEGE